MNTPAIEREYHEDATAPEGEDWVFVFGSNLQGRHGNGAALLAKTRFGAIPGVASGPQGSAYAIPTKSKPTRRPEDVLPLEVIAREIDRFIAYAAQRPHVRFFVTRVGCGLSAIPDKMIAPLFERAPANCSMPEPWRTYFA